MPDVKSPRKGFLIGNRQLEIGNCIRCQAPGFRYQMPRIKQSILPSDPLGRCQVERERKEIYRLSIRQGDAWRGPTLKTIMPYITLAFCYLLGASCLAHSQPSQRKHGCAFVGQKTPASAGLRSDTPQQQWIMGEWVGEFKVEVEAEGVRVILATADGSAVITTAAGTLTLPGVELEVHRP